MTIAIILLAFAAASLSAETLPGGEAWRILEQAGISFEKGEFGDALALCEKARARHSAEILSRIEGLKTALLPAQVKKAGDDIGTIRAVLEKRNDSVALGILDEIMLNHTPSDFGKSMNTLLGWLEKRMVYPEADHLAGRIYELEGEPAVARTYYLKAWENRSCLDIPDERFTILYRLADLSQRSGDAGSREKYLLLIVQEDSAYGKPGEESPVLTSMIRTLETEKTCDRFFSLYRHANPVALKAYQDLASFYYDDSGRLLHRALPAAVLAAAISATMLDEAVAADDFSYEYAGMSDLFVRVGKKPQIGAWAKNQNVWDSFNLLARILRDHGETDAARSILNLMASSCPDPAALMGAHVEMTGIMY